MALLPLICALSGVVGLQQSGAPAAAAAETPVETPLAADLPQSVQDPDAVKVDDIFVVGRRGAARLPPEIELGVDEIDNLGAYDIGEAISRLSQALGLDVPPVVIINGRRVVNPGDFMGFPPDAMVRVEVLPPQAAAVYGEDPRRRVLNIVLQPRFTSRDAFLKGSRPTAGGTSSLGLDARQSEIQDNDTRQFGVQLSRDTALRAEERADYIRDHPDSEGVTLRPAAEAVTANFAVTRAMGDWSGSFSGTARAQDDRFASLSGGQVVQTRRDAQNLSLSGGLAGPAMGWSVRLALQGEASRASQDGISDTRSRNLLVAADLSADRTLFELPAGPAIASLAGRYASAHNANEVQGVDTELTTQALDLRGNLSVPLSRLAEDGPGRRWGDLSLALGGTLTGLYDDAQGEGVNLGLAWSPTRKLSFNGQWSRSEDGPTTQARFNPVYYGPPRTVFDFQAGEFVEVLPLLGGNPALGPQTTQMLSLSASAGPFTSWRLQARTSFQRTSSTDGFGAVPELTPAVEAAFPDRFIRDAAGRLISIDQRQINLGSTRMETLSSGVNINVPVGRDGRSWQVSLNHTWQLANRISLREGLPEIDRLAGDGGGVPRHQVSLQVNGRHGDLGVNASARWMAGSRTRRDSGRDGPDDLVRGAFAAVDLKLSYLLQWAPPPGTEDTGSRRDEGVRLELEVANLFDRRPEATLGDGRPAPGYGRDSQDPLGRVIRFSVSRRF